MAKYHVSKSGEPALCRAQENCPLGDEKDHIMTNDINEARAFAEKKLTEEYTSVPETQKNTQDSLRKLPFEELNKINTKNTQRFLAANKAYWDSYHKAAQENGGKKPTGGLPINNEMFQAAQERRQAYFEFVKSDQVHKELAAENNFDRSEIYTSEEYYKSQIDSSLKWRERNKIPAPGEYTTGSFDPNPNFNEDAGGQANYHFAKAVSTIAVLSGRDKDDIKNEIAEIQQSTNVDRMTATKEVWKNTETRTDKPFVYIDVETAARQDVEHRGQQAFDKGEFSEIIEVGYVKVYPDGTKEEGDFQTDMTPSFKEAIGTGWEGHQITPADIEGKPKFSDPEIQKKMMDVLNGSVYVAHNAPYEKANFSWSLEGFGEASKKKDIEGLDSKDATTYFVHTIKGNRNKDLVETTGSQYGADAHRAKADADMTSASIMEVLNNKEAYLKGDHVNNEKIKKELEEENKSKED